MGLRIPASTAAQGVVPSDLEMIPGDPGPQARKLSLRVGVKGGE